MFLPVGTADTGQTPQAATVVAAVAAAVPAAEIAERPAADVAAAVAAPSSAERLVAVAGPVELALLAWSCRWRSAGAFAGPWRGTST